MILSLTGFKNQSEVKVWAVPLTVKLGNILQKDNLLLFLPLISLLRTCFKSEEWFGYRHIHSTVEIVRSVVGDENRRARCWGQTGSQTVMCCGQDSPWLRLSACEAPVRDSVDRAAQASPLLQTCHGDTGRLTRCCIERLQPSVCLFFSTSVYVFRFCCP